MPIGFLVRFGNRSSLALAFLDLFERLATSDVLTHWLRRFGFACEKLPKFRCARPRINFRMRAGDRREG